MKKTLLVQYLPSGQKSSTQKLLNLFLKKIDLNSVEKVDLLIEKIPFFTEKSLEAYKKRNYLGTPLSQEESELLKIQDRLTHQLKKTDILVMAYPMHNFSMPAAVKTYLDAVIQKGVTFEYGKKPMEHQKVLTLYTSGGNYDSESFGLENPSQWDGITFTAKANFGFMGFKEIEVLGTSLRDPQKIEENLHLMESKIDSLVKRWYE